MAQDPKVRQNPSEEIGRTIDRSAARF